ncbi:zinc-binding dehydrogenase [Amycolatopsis jejuensis]|uniref:zinc-binding dehydrogenase n=1 Tax=Amycolatopsis jejuensis TaxID=330084 RepID=UPI000526E17A|nr:zinc-binding dehydrogenase [Amycolatopsis jejuensis]
MANPTQAPGRATIAAVEDYGQTPVMLDVPLPEPENGALVVEMELATVCGSDIHQWIGDYAKVFDLRLPLCSGHEGVGVVTEQARGTVDSVGHELRPGDRVVWESEGCGQCHECTVLHEDVLCQNRRVGMQWAAEDFPYTAATFGTHSYVWPRSGRLRVPDGVKSEWASAASCALRTVIASLDKVPLIRPTDTVLVQGAGPLGLFAAAILSTYHPRRLITVGDPAGSLDLAREWGATDTISIARTPEREARKAAVENLTAGRGADVVFEFAGATGAFSEALDLAARGATVVAVGSVGGALQPVSAANVVNKQLTVRGSYSARIGHYASALSFMERYADRYDWDRLFGNRYRLDQLGEAFDAMRSGREIKPIIATQEVG